MALPDEDENEFASVGVAYDLGAGVDTNLTLMYINRDAEAGGAGTDNEAFAVVWGWWLWF